KRSIASAVVRLGGHENLLPPASETFAEIIQTPVIRGSRVEIIDAQLQRSMDDRDGFLDSAVGSQHPLAAQPEDRYFLAGVPQRPLGNLNCVWHGSAPF